MNPTTDDNVPTTAPAHPLQMRDELKAAMDTALPQTPGQFGEHLIKQKWGADIDPQTSLLATLDYDYRGHPAQNGLHQGQVASSRTLVQTLLSNYQTVGDGRFGETAFGLYTPPDIGPAVRIVENVDEFADHGSGNHRTYEGVYRRTVPQTYGPDTQIKLRPADFKEWVWKLDFKYLYEGYLQKAWPSDEAIVASRPYALRTSVKAAFVMTAWLQFQENCLSKKGLELAMAAAGLAPGQTWESLTISQLQATTRLSANIETGLLKLYRYTARDIWCYRDRSSGRVLLYIPGNSSPLHEFADKGQMRQWIVEQGKAQETKQALAAHFADEDRQDGTFHAGVLTALDGLAIFPRQHHLTKESGFFNNDGYWDPVDYIGVTLASSNTDPFAQLVLTMKQTARDSAQTIRDDAQVNRDNLSAVVEPIVQWVNQFGPLALFVPGGEGLLVLAGLIDAGYGLDQAVNGKTSAQRSQGVTRTVFGLLNALPLATGVASLSKEGEAMADVKRESAVSNGPTHEAAPAHVSRQPEPPLPTRTELLRGVGAPAGTFTDEVLAQIGKVSAIDDNMLRLMQEGRSPTPQLGDTIDRFRIDQQVMALGDPSTAQAEFNRRYQALQQSDHEWVQLFQRTYPDLPKAAVEQMLDRYGVDFKAPPDPVQARDLFKQLDSKARQYQQHVRLNRAYEGLYLRAVSSPDSDTLALHSLANLPGWPKGLRIDVRDSSIGGRILDRTGPIDTPDYRALIKSGTGYSALGLSTPPAAPTDFYEAVYRVLTEDEHRALGLASSDLATELKLKIREHPLSRSDWGLGLSRMDSGLPFEAQGLRGGGHPATPQGPALTHETVRLQLKEVYPDLSNDEADAILQPLGGAAQAYIDDAQQQLQQLYADMEAWLDQVALDADDMEVDFLNTGDPEAQGMTATQIARENLRRLEEVMRYERETRAELADELIAIFQKRAPLEDSHYTGNHVDGFAMNMKNEDFHRLPSLNVRFNDVIELDLSNFHLFERETLNGYLECFPRLRVLDLEGTDLRLPNADGELESVLPSAILQLKHLTSLNLRSTRLSFQNTVTMQPVVLDDFLAMAVPSNTAGKLSTLINLQVLDLSDNPLVVPPVVTGMNQLRSLKLKNTGIKTCPVGISDQPYLTTLDLQENRIERVPQAVLNQAIARDRVLLWHNPLTDEDTLQRLVAHRERTGLNLWLDAPGQDSLGPTPWLRDIEEGQRNAQMQVWQRLALKPGGKRFLGVMSTLTLTADFRVNYLNLQARVWRLLIETDASPELAVRLTQDVPLPSGAFDNPFAVFTALEDRMRLYNDWVALGRPFTIHQP